MRALYHRPEEDGIAFAPLHPVQLRYFPASRTAPDLGDPLHPRGQELADRGDGNRPLTGDQAEKLGPAEGVAGGVRMERSHRALVSGVENLKQIEHLGAATLSENQAIGPHPERLLEQGAQRDLAASVGVGGPADEAEKMGMAGRKLGGVLESDDSLMRGDGREKIGGEGRFAAARSA
jgi:hypothetical protein